MSENIPPNFGSIKTVKDLIEALSKLDPNKPVSLLVEFDGQYEDSLRNIIDTNNRVVLMGLERLCPEYEALNPKTKD